MRVVVQRVKSAGVTNAQGIEHSIQKGLVLLVGFDATDIPVTVAKCIQKIVQLRIFNDSAGKMNRSVIDVAGAILIIPNFTLSASLVKGNRPSFDSAMSPEEARRLFDYAIRLCQTSASSVRAGFFGETMTVDIKNDGPVTFIVSDNL